jgi:nitrogen regulatory protein PII-like uncharacterized protein
MKLTAWTWIIFGAIISVMSGYIYLFVPKNGQPNNAMALFFFIGTVFIIIGIVKLMFKRVDDKNVFDSVEKSIRDKPEDIIKIPTTVQEQKYNKVEETINKLAEMNNSTNNPIHQNAQQNHNLHKHTSNKPHHTNTYYQIHQYKGPIHTPNTGAHNKHPVTQHTHTKNISNTHVATHHTTNTHTHATSHRIQNTAEHSIRCRACSNVNSGHSNYCHKCGHRLK